MHIPDDVPEHMRLPIKLVVVFMPKAFSHRIAYYARRNQTRFVHYTSAEAAINILEPSGCGCRTPLGCGRSHIMRLRCGNGPAAVQRSSWVWSSLRVMVSMTGGRIVLL